MKRGVYGNVDGDYMFFNEDGICEDKNIEITGFKVSKDKYNRYSLPETKYDNLKKAIKQALIRLKYTLNDSIGIYICYKNEYNKYGNTERLFTIEKQFTDKENKYKISLRLNGSTFFFDINKPDEVINIQKKNTEDFIIPKEWFISNRKKGNPVMDKMLELQGKYNMTKISFDVPINNEEKLNELLNLELGLSRINNNFNINKFKPYNISYSKIRTAGTWWRDKITLKKNRMISTLYHEYGHHIFGNGYNFNEELFENFLNELLKTTTMKQFLDRHERSIIFNKKDKNYNQIAKNAKHYNYWTDGTEMFARFFSDYIMFNNSTETLDIFKSNEHYKNYEYSYKHYKGCKIASWESTVRLEFNRDEIIALTPMLENILRECENIEWKSE